MIVLNVLAHASARNAAAAEYLYSIGSSLLRGFRGIHFNESNLAVDWQMVSCRK
jgi:hypothetical protein